MQGNDFEERLRRQPLRKLPAEWRNDILSAAHARPESGQSYYTARSRMPLSALKACLAGLLWPSPKAWSGLAATWLLLLGINHAVLNDRNNFSSLGQRPAAAVIMTWKEQQRVLTELMQPAQSASIQPSKHAPSPRSERSGALKIA